MEPRFKASTEEDTTPIRRQHRKLSPHLVRGDALAIPADAYAEAVVVAKSDRGRGCHTALLHRCILDAAKHSPTLFAETCEPLGSRDGPSAGCRNLLRAGFSQASVRQAWRPQRG